MRAAVQIAAGDEEEAEAARAKGRHMNIRTIVTASPGWHVLRHRVKELEDGGVAFTAPEIRAVVAWALVVDDDDESYVDAVCVADEGGYVTVANTSGIQKTVAPMPRYHEELVSPGSKVMVSRRKDGLCHWSVDTPPSPMRIIEEGEVEEPV